MTPRAVQRGEWLRRWVWVLFDGAIWFVAIFGATWVRFDFRHDRLFAATTALIRLSGRRDIGINYTGLRPGEKISEDLFSAHEDRQATSNPLVTSVDVPILSVDEVRSLNLDSHQRAANWMRHQSAQIEQAGV